jgi:hypothetical protein
MVTSYVQMNVFNLSFGFRRNAFCIWKHLYNESLDLIRLFHMFLNRSTFQTNGDVLTL